MFGFFNIGLAEIIVLLVGGIFCIGVTIGVVVLVVFLSRQKDQGRVFDRQATLDAENQHHRDELERRTAHEPDAGKD